MRRRTLFVGGIVLAAASAGLVSWATRPESIAASADGSLQVIAAAYDTHIEYTERDSGWTSVLGRRHARRDVGTAVLFVWYCARLQWTEEMPDLASRCGCRFRLAALGPVRGGRDGERIDMAPTFPRRDRELVLELRDATVRFANPAPAPPPASTEGVGDLPVSLPVGDETWVLAPDPDPTFVSVRAVDARRSGIYWQIRGARFRDASGNVVLRSKEPFAREHRIRLPLADDPFHLCPHEPWWELELDVADGKTVTFRFRPPRADDAPK